MFKSARQVISALADDGKSVEYTVSPDGEVVWGPRTARQIIGAWLTSAGQAGDTAVVEAIEALGEEEAATEYVARATDIAAR